MANYFDKLNQESQEQLNPVQDPVVASAKKQLNQNDDLDKLSEGISGNQVVEKKPNAFVSFLMWFFLTAEVTMFILGCIDWWNGSQWYTFGWIGVGCAIVVFIITAFRLLKKKKRTSSLVGIIVALPIFVLTLCGIISESNCYPSYRTYYNPYIAQTDDFVYIGRLGVTINTQETLGYGDYIVIRVNNEEIPYYEENQKGI